MANQSDVRLVRGVADGLDDAIEVSLDGDEIVVSGHGVTERYDTAEEAICGLRASWRHAEPPADGGAS